MYSRRIGRILGTSTSRWRKAAERLRSLGKLSGSIDAIISLPYDANVEIRSNDVLGLPDLPELVRRELNAAIRDVQSAIEIYVASCFKCCTKLPTASGSETN